MIDGLFQPTHLLLILLVLFFLFGGKKIPELAKGLGEGIRHFKSSVKGEEEKPVTKQTPTNP
jgi:sec-independent protein translocase protein TatA